MPLHLGRWRPELHPRDHNGEFSRSPGGGAAHAPHSPGGVPDASGHAPGKPGKSPAAHEPLNDAQYTEHTKRVEAAIGAAIKAGEETHLKYTLNGDGETYTPQRAKLHKAIVDDIYSKQAATAKSEGKSIIAGGLGGAGKSTVLGKHAGVDSADYVTVNPDEVKEVMAERGMIPNVEGVSPMESAALVHEESSLIANMVAKRAYADGKNVIWDITMSRAASVQKRINELRANGYGDIQGVFVDIPVETSVRRALSRHRRGMEKHRAGDGHGGRYVPPHIIRANATATASSANRQVFNSLRSQFDTWQLYDNSGTAPVRLDSSHSDDHFDAGQEVAKAEDRTRAARDAARQREQQGQDKRGRRRG